MSGFLALVDMQGGALTRETLRNLAEPFQRCRQGEPQGWISTDGRIGLAHARLYPPSTSECESWPCTLDGRVWIVADARIDDRAGLIHRLRANGRALHGAISDADLILHAYHHWDTSCLDYLIGDFAFAIWDETRQRLFCARDQLGTVPIYYAQTSRNLLVSTSLACIRRHPHVSTELNSLAIADFLLFGSNYDVTTTTFSAIQRLPPAHRLCWTPDGMDNRRYWTLSEEKTTVPGKDREVAQGFLTLLTEAVSDRLRWPQAAVTLSGGLDSTTVAALSAQLLDPNRSAPSLQAYTFGFDWLMEDSEVAYARMVADRYGIPLDYIPSEDCLLSAREPGDFDPPPEPSMSIVSPEWREIRLRAAASGRPVLTGFGGDPLLQMPTAYWTTLLRDGRWQQFAREAAQHMARHHRLPGLGLRRAVRRLRGRTTGDASLPPWLNRDFVERHELEARYHWLLAEQRTHFGVRGMVHSPFWSNLLANASPTVTCSPVKILFPFFDLRLLQYVQGIPASPWRVNKLLIRDSMSDILPEPVRLRRKTPLQSWPYHALALQHRAPSWLTAFPESQLLSEFVDTDVTRETIRSPERWAGWQYQSALRPISLAYWLQPFAA